MVKFADKYMTDHRWRFIDGLIKLKSNNLLEDVTYLLKRLIFVVFTNDKLSL